MYLEMSLSICAGKALYILIKSVLFMQGGQKTFHFDFSLSLCQLFRFTTHHLSSTPGSFAEVKFYGAHKGCKGGEQVSTV